MNTQEFLQKTEKYVKKKLSKDQTGHDYKHTKRVLKNALKIAKNYPNADKETIIIACLLHDISFKDGFVKNHHLVGAKQSKKFLKKLKFPDDKTKKVKIIIEDHVRNISKPIRPNSKICIESKILVDADNIDALGRIGIQRAIKFNKKANRPKIITKKDKFNESLYGSLKGMIPWADNMLTSEGKKIGKQKINVMKEYFKKLEKKLK